MDDRSRHRTSMTHEAKVVLSHKERHSMEFGGSLGRLTFGGSGQLITSGTARALANAENTLFRA
jgi:hypothetical protein